MAWEEGSKVFPDTDGADAWCDASTKEEEDSEHQKMQPRSAQGFQNQLIHTRSTTAMRNAERLVQV
jgi:hypothetical protein